MYEEIVNEFSMGVVKLGTLCFDMALVRTLTAESRVVHSKDGGTGNELSRRSVSFPDEAYWKKCTLDIGVMCKLKHFPCIAR